MQYLTKSVLLILFVLNKDVRCGKIGCAAAAGPINETETSKNRTTEDALNFGDILSGLFDYFFDGDYSYDYDDDDDQEQTNKGSPSDVIVPPVQLHVHVIQSVSPTILPAAGGSQDKLNQPKGQKPPSVQVGGGSQGVPNPPRGKIPGSPPSNGQGNSSLSGVADASQNTFNQPIGQLGNGSQVAPSPTSAQAGGGAQSALNQQNGQVAGSSQNQPVANTSQNEGARSLSNVQQIPLIPENTLNSEGVAAYQAPGVAPDAENSPSIQNPNPLGDAQIFDTSQGAVNSQDTPNSKATDEVKAPGTPEVAENAQNIPVSDGSAGVLGAATEYPENPTNTENPDSTGGEEAVASQNAASP